MAVMPQRERTSAQIIVDEIRRQVELQAKASEGLDTRAMAVFGGVAVVAVLVADRVTVHDVLQGVAAVITLGLLLGALFCLLMSVLPKIGKFSNGPDVSQLGKRISEKPSDLERELVSSFVKVRGLNEDFLKSKAGWMINALWFLIGTVIGIAFMVGVGAIK